MSPLPRSQLGLILNFGISVFWVLLSTSQATAAIALPELIQLAIENNPELAQAQATREQRSAQRAQLLGELFPQATLSYTYLNQTPLADGFARSIFPAEQNTVRLGASWNLFSGGRTAAGILQKAFALDAAELQWEAQKWATIEVVTTAYWDWCYRQDIHSTFESEIQIANQVQGRLKSSRMSGRLTETGQLATEIQIAGTESEALDAAQQTNFALSRLEAQVGAPLSKAGDAPGQCSMNEYDRNQAKEILTHDRPAPDQLPLSVQALVSEETAASRALLSSWGGLLPRIDASANYYPVRPVGINQEIRWDVGITVSWTLFDGLIQVGRIREQASLVRLASARLHRERIAKRDSRTQLSTRLTTLLAQLEKIEPADADATAQFEKKKRDFSRGLASDLELLESAGLRARTHRLKTRYLFDLATTSAQLRSLLAQPYPGVPQ